MRLAVVLLLLLPQGALAQKMSAPAQAKLEEGVRLHESGDYAGAIEAFRAGYQLQANRDFLYAIAQSERKRGNCRGAIDAYRAFLADKPPAKEARKAETNIRRCEVALAEEKPTKTQPEPQRQPEPEPEPQPQPEPEPRREPEPAPQPVKAAAKPEVAEERKIDWIGTGLYAGGGMALAVGGALLVMANSTASAANSAGTLDEFEDKRAAARDLRYFGYGTIVVGAAVVGAAVLRTILRADDDLQVGAAPAAGGGAAFVLGGRF